MNEKSREEAHGQRGISGPKKVIRISVVVVVARRKSCTTPRGTSLVVLLFFIKHNTILQAFKSFFTIIMFSDNTKIGTGLLFLVSQCQLQITNFVALLERAFVVSFLYVSPRDYFA
jgi:hypothetical protein